MNDISGRTSGRQFAFYDHDLSSWRMWPATGLWGSIEFSETWPKTGSMSGGRAYEHQTSVPRITGSDCSSLRSRPGKMLGTPTAWEQRGDASSDHRDLLPLQAQRISGMLPTPIAADGDRERNNPSQARRKSPPLSAVGHLLPTPTAREGKTSDTEVEWSRNSPALGAVTAHFPTPRTTDANGAGRHGTGGPDLRTVVTEMWSGEPTLPLFDVGSG